MQASILRAVRAYLGLNQSDLANEISVSRQVILRAEEGHISAETKARLESYFKSHNIAISDDGFKVRRETFQTLYGQDGFHELYKLMHQSVRRGNKDVWIYNANTDAVAGTLGHEFQKEHKQVMTDLFDRLNMRVVVEEGDDRFWGCDYAYYKWIDTEHFNEKTVYVFGNKTALVDFGDDVIINLIDSEDFTKTLKLFLETVWENKAYDPIDTEKPFRPI